MSPAPGRVFGLILAGASLWGIGEGMFLYYHTLYLGQLGASPVFIGALFSVVAVCQMVVQVPAGYLADRFGRRALLRAGWLMAVSSTLIFALAGSLPVFALGLVVNGLMAIGWASQYNYIANIPARFSPGRAVTLVLAFAFGGSALGAFLGGQISALAGIRAAYQAAVVFALLSAGFIFRLPDQPLAPAAQPGLRNGLVYNRLFVAFLGVLLVVSTGMYVPFLFSPNYLKDAAGLDLRQIGSLGAVAGAGNVAVLLLLGSLRPYRAFLTGQALVAVFAVLMLVGRGLGAFYLAFFCLGGMWLARSIAAVIVRSLVEENQSGVAVGLGESVKTTAAMLAPLLAGALYQQAPVSIFSAGLAILLLGLALSAALLFRLRGQLEVYSQV